MTAAEATPDLDIAIRDNRDDTAFLGHPKGLGYLAFTEAWERFSYYGMQTLLVLYMVNELLLPGHVENIAFFESFRPLYGGLDGQPLASAIFGTYTALVYLTPILGGFLADRVLGKTPHGDHRRGHHGRRPFPDGVRGQLPVRLALPHPRQRLLQGQYREPGRRSLRPGGHAPRRPPSRSSILGINAGVIASPLVVGTLGEEVGWHWGFGAAGVGMLIGLVIYLSGQKYLPKEHMQPGSAEQRARRERLSPTDWLAVIALIMLIPVMAVAFLPNQQIFNAYLVWGDRSSTSTFSAAQLPTSWLITLDAITSVSFLALVAIFYEAASPQDGASRTR